MKEEEAIKEIENYLDYEGSVSIQAIATLYTLYEKEKEKNKKLENKIDRALQELDTGVYTAYTLYGDILFRDNDLVSILREGKTEYELEEE